MAPEYCASYGAQISLDKKASGAKLLLQREKEERGMVYQHIHLKDYYPFLASAGCDPILTTYLPDITAEMAQTDQIRPAILILPGGGYSYVSTREAEPIALNFIPKGFRVFLLEYSIAPHTYPTALREVACALDLIHTNQTQWCVDATKIAIMGFSAGGHLAGHYSNCYDCPEIREHLPNSRPVNAAVLCYPVISATEELRHLKSFQNISGNNEISEEIINKFSLEKLVSGKTPPTFLWHTREDKLVPVGNSLLYAQALAQQGTPFALHVYPFGSHGLATADGITCGPGLERAKAVHAWMDAATQWLNDTL